MKTIIFLLGCIIGGIAFSLERSRENDRIELQKNRILEKLNLREVPSVSGSVPIPRRMLRKFNSDSVFTKEYVSNREYQPDGDEGVCDFEGDVLESDCYRFVVAVKSLHIKSAILRFRVLKTLANEEISIDVRRIVHHESADLLMTNQTYTTTKPSDHGLKFDFTDFLIEWQRDESTEYMELCIKIRLTNATVNTVPILSISGTKNIDIPNYECGLGDNSGCCLVPYFVNFTEIGWSNWILAPDGYWANYCMGGCELEKNPILKKSFSAVETSSVFGLPQPECAPSRYDPLRIIYAISDSEIRSSTMHGMRVLECSCHSSAFARHD